MMLQVRRNWKMCLSVFMVFILILTFMKTMVTKTPEMKRSNIGQSRKHLVQLGMEVEDIMPTKPIEFLPGYKNPCWYGTKTNGHINDGKLHCLPYFCVIAKPYLQDYFEGMKKCGTTDLFARIVSHPSFKYTGFKESQWFTRVRYNVTFTKRTLSYVKKGPTTGKLSYYVSIFDSAANDISQYNNDSSRNINPYITGEGTHGNLHHNPYWEQMD